MLVFSFVFGLICEELEIKDCVIVLIFGCVGICVEMSDLIKFVKCSVY